MTGGAPLHRFSLRRRRCNGPFVFREIRIVSGGERCYQEGEWEDSLVVVEEGEIDLVCGDQSSMRFVAGDVVALCGLPLVAMCNPGPVTAVLSAVRRA